MHAVGHHLQQQAVIATGSERDAFARSSFNRYYYSAFLNIRKTLGSINPSWSNLPHASYPDVLKGRIWKNLSEGRRRAYKADDRNLVKRIDTAKRAIHELATTIEAAYGVRIVADYEPEELVDFGSHPRFSLKSIDVTDAHEWDNKTRILCDSIKNAWREVNE